MCKDLTSGFAGNATTQVTGSAVDRQTRCRTPSRPDSFIRVRAGWISNCDYSTAMKRFYYPVIVLALAIVLNACESTGGDAATDSPVKSGGTVPGEKTADEGMSATAGPGSAAAGMRW